MKATRVIFAMSLFETIAPIFLIILVGYVVKRGRLFKDDFFIEANRFVYYFSLPVLIFLGIVKSGLQAFSLTLILSVVLPTVAMFLLGCGLGRLMGLRGGRFGTFAQATFHGNVSYIGLAVVFYMLGENAFRQGSLMVGFLVLTTNLLSSLVLCLATSSPGQHALRPLVSVAKNPVIISSVAGICALQMGLPVPILLMKSMTVLANIALPLALITIGASLTLAGAGKSWRLSLLVSFIKLLVLPALAILFLKMFELPLEEASTSILLLATPVATLAYIMAEQLGGDGELASHAVTLSTVLSLFTYMGWALVLGIA
jgi:malate permease and related proteins